KANRQQKDCRQIGFDRANVAARRAVVVAVERTCASTLIGGGAACIVARIECSAAGEQGMRLRRTAVILQWTKVDRCEIQDIAGACRPAAARRIPNQIEASVVERAAIERTIRRAA